MACGVRVEARRPRRAAAAAALSLAALLAAVLLAAALPAARAALPPCGLVLSKEFFEMDYAWNVNDTLPTETLVRQNERPEGVPGSAHYFDAEHFLEWILDHYDELGEMDTLRFFCSTEGTGYQHVQNLTQTMLRLCRDADRPAEHAEQLGASEPERYRNTFLDLSEKGFAYIGHPMVPSRSGARPAAGLLFDALFPDCDLRRQRFVPGNCFAVRSSTLRQRPAAWYFHLASLLHSHEKFEFEELLPRIWECVFTLCLCDEAQFWWQPPSISGGRAREASPVERYLPVGTLKRLMQAVLLLFTLTLLCGAASGRALGCRRGRRRPQR